MEQQYYPYIYQWLAQTRPIGRLIAKGHTHHGYTSTEGYRVEVESDIETCGTDLRVIISEGANLRYTARITKIGSGWMVANRFATLNVWNKQLGKVQEIRLSELRFRNPFSFTNWLYEAIYRSSVRQERVVAEAVQ